MSSSILAVSREREFVCQLYRLQHIVSKANLCCYLTLTSDHINNFCFVVLPSSEKKFTRFSEARRAKFLPLPNFFIIIIASLFCNNRTNLNLMCRNKATLYLKVVTFIQNIWPLAEIKVCCHTGQTSWRGPRNTMQFYAGGSCHFFWSCWTSRSATHLELLREEGLGKNSWKTQQHQRPKIQSFKAIGTRAFPASALKLQNQKEFRGACIWNRTGRHRGRTEQLLTNPSHLWKTSWRSKFQPTIRNSYFISVFLVGNLQVALTVAPACLGFFCAQRRRSSSTSPRPGTPSSWSPSRFD